MPHALMLMVGDNVTAWKAFDEAMPQDVPRIILADTFEDERTEVLKAVQLLKDRIYGVRLDTPSSRRGSMRKIVAEIKWTLRIHGFNNVRIIVSGGIDEDDILELRDLVDGFGVGDEHSLPPSVDFSADIVEKFVNGKWVPFTKRGKWPGRSRCGGAERPPDNDVITLLDEAPPNPNCKPLLVKYMEEGNNQGYTEGKRSEGVRPEATEGRKARKSKRRGLLKVDLLQVLQRPIHGDLRYGL